MGKERKMQGFWRESPEERDNLKDRGVDGTMGLEWILGREAWGAWSGFTWLWIGSVASSGVCDGEISGSGATELVS
jgi:hypothetical protein